MNLEGQTWRDLTNAVGIASEDADYMLWNASAFPFDYPRAIYEQLRHAVRHKVCIDLLPSDYDAELEARYADSLYGPAHDPENYRRGAPTNCYPRTKYDRHGRRTQHTKGVGNV